MRNIIFLLFFFSIGASAADWRIENDHNAIAAVARLAKLNPRAQLKAVRAEGICVKVLDSGRKAPKGFFLWRDAERPIGKLSEVTAKGALMGKTLCKRELPIAESCTTVVMADDAPRVTLLHEYLHTKQIAKDKAWCEISKRLWTESGAAADTRQLQDREWDVLTTLWENRRKLQLDPQDRVAVAGEILDMAPQRKGDSSAQRFIQKQGVESELAKAADEYRKGLKR